MEGWEGAHAADGTSASLAATRLSKETISMNNRARAKREPRHLHQHTFAPSVQTPIRASNNPASRRAKAEEKLRSDLRKVFDEYDTDGSGTISTDELEAVITRCKINLPQADIARIAHEADADGSGEIEFEEFIATLKKQAAANGGGAESLLSVVSQTSAFNLNWLNPMSWFASDAAPAAAEAATPQEPRRDEDRLRRPRQHHISTQASGIDVGVQTSTRTPSSKPRPPSRSSSPSLSPSRQSSARRSSRSQAASVRSHRSVLSEWMVKEQNAAMAEEQRQLEQELRAQLDAQHEAFLVRQRERIRLFHQGEVEKAEALEVLKALKRQRGVEMRQEVQRRYHKVQSLAAERAKVVSAHTVEVRRIKKEETAARYEEKRRTAEAVGIQAQEERRLRREATKATVRAQEQAAIDYAAQVRYDTRPDVRKETREYFQAQRDSKYKMERDKQEQDRAERKVRARFAARHDHVHVHVLMCCGHVACARCML